MPVLVHIQNTRTHWREAALVALILAVSNVFLLAPDGSPLRVIAAVSFLFLPGLAWAAILLPNAEPLLRWIIGCGLGIALAIVTGLLLHFVPGPIALWQWVVASDLLVAAAIVGLLLVRNPPTYVKLADPPKYLILLLLITLLGGVFRFTDLGYSEYQGDEIEAVAPAARAIEGYEDALTLQRRKAPAEVLLPMLVWRTAGVLNEGSARLPFALIGTLIIPTCYVMGRRLLNARAGLAAALWIALCGLFVAFSRIVQYQMIVVLMSALTLLCAWEWRDRGPLRWATLAGFFLGAGLLAHYDAIIVTPALVYVAATALLDRSDGTRRPKWRAIGASLMVAGVSLLVAGIFYGTYLADPQFMATSSYLGGRVGGGLLYNNLPSFLHFNTIYSSFYFVCITGLFACGYIAWALIVRTVTREQRSVMIWGGVGFLAYVFLIQKPNTHIYVIVTPWMLLAGLGATLLWDRLQGRTARMLTLAGIAGMVLIFGGYVYTVYLRQDVEYWQDWPASRPSFYWAPDNYADLGGLGIFGMVHRSGWKAIGTLMDQGQLAVTHDSNDKPEITIWYTRNAPRPGRDEQDFCGSKPETIVLGDDLVEHNGAFAVDPDLLASDYERVGNIVLPNGKGVTIYTLPGAPRLPQTLDGAELEAAFDRTATPAAFVHDPMPQISVNANLDNKVRLIGYDLNCSTADGHVALTLYWQALTPIPADYHAFVHVEGGLEPGSPGGVWGQSNGVPGDDHPPVILGNDTRMLAGQPGRDSHYPTSLWRAGQVIRDLHSFEIVPETPQGSYALVVGLYRPDTGERLPVIDAEGKPGNNYVKLMDIPVPGMTTGD